MPILENDSLALRIKLGRQTVLRHRQQFPHLTLQESISIPGADTSRLEECANLYLAAEMGMTLALEKEIAELVALSEAAAEANRAQRRRESRLIFPIRVEYLDHVSIPN